MWKEGGRGEEGGGKGGQGRGNKQTKKVVAPERSWEEWEKSVFLIYFYLFLCLMFKRKKNICLPGKEVLNIVFVAFLASRIIVGSFIVLGEKGMFVEQFGFVFFCAIFTIDLCSKVNY